MAITGLSITKKVMFRGFAQEFSNVYFYQGGSINATDASNLIATVKAIEVDLHSTDVTFVRAAVWSAGGSPLANAMILQQDLTGTGAGATNSNLDRERAFLCQWKAGLDSRGRQVYLRKWFHSCGAINGINPVAAWMQNTSQIDTTSRTTIGNKVDDLQSLTIGANNLDLSSASGRARTSGVIVYPWLEHHQLGDQWR